MPFDGNPEKYGPAPAVVIEDDAVLKALVDSRALLEKGWVQHIAEYDGRVCMIGGLRKATRSTRYHQNVIYDLAAREVKWALLWSPSYWVIAFTELVGGLSIAFWNDAPWRNKRQVLKVFDRAIRRHRRRHAV